MSRTWLLLCLLCFEPRANDIIWFKLLNVLYQAILKFLIIISIKCLLPQSTTEDKELFSGAEPQLFGKINKMLSPGIRLWEWEKVILSHDGKSDTQARELLWAKLNLTNQWIRRKQTGTREKNETDLQSTAKQSEVKRYYFGSSTCFRFVSETSWSLPLAIWDNSLSHGKFSLFILLA